MERQIELVDDAEAVRVFGVHDRNLKRLRDHFGVEVTARDRRITLSGDEDIVNRAGELLDRMVENARNGSELPDELLDRALEEDDVRDLTTDGEPVNLETVGKSDGQRGYVRAMAKAPIVFATGPAGTGKTYLAVLMAVDALKRGIVRKLVLCRPAVEAGEKLGFLPGDFHAKVNPYLRPLYDALNELLDYDQVRRYTDREIIEIVPLAYMRGRTLNRSFIILDEGQNTTTAQMKMFLTRMGMGSRIVVTGDVTQVDLPQGQPSGLLQARRILSGIEGIQQVELTRFDIVRHPLVSEIVDAYDRHEGLPPASPRKSRRRDTR